MESIQVNVQHEALAIVQAAVASSNISLMFTRDQQREALASRFHAEEAAEAGKIIHISESDIAHNLRQSATGHKEGMNAVQERAAEATQAAQIDNTLSTESAGIIRGALDKIARSRSHFAKVPHDDERELAAKMQASFSHTASIVVPAAAPPQHHAAAVSDHVLAERLHVARAAEASSIVERERELLPAPAAAPAATAASSSLKQHISLRASLKAAIKAVEDAEYKAAKAQAQHSPLVSGGAAVKPVHAHKSALAGQPKPTHSADGLWR